MIVATAGHVDHGKTALIKALSGFDTTHLPEERKRGMTIDLGFATLALGSGNFIEFIDVPGHERFLRNMMAGVFGIDFVLLVIAADDGIMPQTREHLEIIDLLGVSSGAVVITKIDRVPISQVSAVAKSVEELLSPTNLAQVPIFPVASLENRGVSALRDHLVASVTRSGPSRRGADFRMPVDRCFTIEGAGLVLTGTVAAGRVTSAEQLLLTPGMHSVRIRGLHRHGTSVQSCGVGERSALNIVSTVDKKAIGRGGWLVAPRVASVSTNLDVRLKVVPLASVRDNARVHFYHGAGCFPARAIVLQSERDGTALAQLTLSEPVHALARDSFVLRDAADTRTLAGGVVLDPYAPTRGKRTSERIALLNAVDQHDATVAFHALLAVAAEGIEVEQFSRAWNLSTLETESLWQSDYIVKSDSRAFCKYRWDHIHNELCAIVDLWHKHRPYSLGPLCTNVAHTQIKADRTLRQAVLSELIRNGHLVREGDRVRRPLHVATFRLSEKVIWERIAPLLQPPVGPMPVHDIAGTLRLQVSVVRRVLEISQRARLAVRISTNRYLPTALYERMVALAQTLADESTDGLFDAAAYRDRISLGRKVAVELLEHFDSVGFTNRSGNLRRIINRDFF